MDATLVIMAAGLGSRYGGLKQIDPLGPNGETLLEYAAYDAIQAGFTKLVFVIRSDFEKGFKTRIGSRLEDRIEVCCVCQALDHLPSGFAVPPGRVRPWGTGQAVFACREAVKTPFAVQNADDFYGADAYRATIHALHHLPENGSCMVGYPLRRTLSPHGSVSRGICTMNEGRLGAIVERTQIESTASGQIVYVENHQPRPMRGDEICSMNFWGFQPALFDRLERYFAEFLLERGAEPESEWHIPGIVNAMLRSNETQVQVLPTNAGWFGVTYPEDRPAVMRSLAAMHASKAYPAPLWK